MYPGFAKVAREEGFHETAQLFETLAKIERFHAGRFNEVLEKYLKAKGEKTEVEDEELIKCAFPKSNTSSGRFSRLRNTGR